MKLPKFRYIELTKNFIQYIMGEKIVKSRFFAGRQAFYEAAGRKTVGQAYAKEKKIWHFRNFSKVKEKR